MGLNSEEVEKLLRKKKSNIAKTKYLKEHPGIRKKHRMKNYRKYKSKRLLYAKDYRDKNRDKFKNYNKLQSMVFKFKFVLVKDNEEIITSAKKTINKLKEGWKIKSVDWSELMK